MNRIWEYVKCDFNCHQSNIFESLLESSFRILEIRSLFFDAVLANWCPVFNLYFLTGIGFDNDKGGPLIIILKRVWTISKDILVDKFVLARLYSLFPLSIPDREFDDAAALLFKPHQSYFLRQCQISLRNHIY